MSETFVPSWFLCYRNKRILPKSRLDNPKRCPVSLRIYRPKYERKRVIVNYSPCPCNAIEVIRSQVRVTETARKVIREVLYFEGDVCTAHIQDCL